MLYFVVKGVEERGGLDLDPTVLDVNNNKKKTCNGQRQNKGGKMLALHAVDPGSVLGTTCGHDFLSTTRSDG